jgi:predicted nucleic acid-binding protein
LNRVYLDTNVFVYAVGGESPHREPCREVLRAVAQRRLAGETSAYALQELVRQRQRRGDGEATKRAREAAAVCSELHPLEWEIVSSAMDLVDRHSRLGIADALHVSTAIAKGIALVVSADRGLDEVPGIERVDPLDRQRFAALTSE